MMKNAFKNGVYTISFLKASEGGQRQTDVIDMLKEAGIPARRGYSIYVGHTAVEVPTKHAERAAKIVFG